MRSIITIYQRDVIIFNVNIYMSLLIGIGNFLYVKIIFLS